MERLQRTLGEPQPLFRGGAGEPARPRALSAVTHARGDMYELASLFGTKLEEVSGSYEIVEGAATVIERIARVIDECASDDTGSKEILSWSPSEIPVPGLEEGLRKLKITLLIPGDLHDEASRAEAAVPEVGLTGVDAAFASTGSVVLASGPGKSRAASLLPLHHIVVVPMSRIFPTFEAWLASRRRGGSVGAFLSESGQVFFITGPSKSADIELNLTLGVHGPRTVHAVVMDDSR